MAGTVQRIGSVTLYGFTTEWLTCGPAQSQRIPQLAPARYVAKKVARGTRSPSHLPRLLRCAPTRALLQNSNLAKSGHGKSVDRTKDTHIQSAQNRATYFA